MMRCFASDNGEGLQLQTPNPLLKAFFFLLLSLMAQRQNVAFNTARNGGGVKFFLG